MRTMNGIVAHLEDAFQLISSQQRSCHASLADDLADADICRLSHQDKGTPSQQGSPDLKQR